MSGTALLAVVRAARPRFRSPHDRVAFALHAGMMTEGYLLVAAGAAAEDDAAAAAAAEEVGVEGWDALPDAYAFCYAPPGGGAARVLVKALVANGTLLAHATTLGGKGAEEPQVAAMELLCSDFVTGAEDTAGGYKDLDVLYGKLKGALASLQLAPAAAAPAPAAAAPRGDERRVPPHDPYADRNRPHPAEPYRDPLVAHDPLRVGAPRRPIPAHGLGHDDLNPFGPGGMPGGLPGMGGGGMMMGPGHPAFGGAFPGGGEMYGGGRLPPGVPPEARFDPYGPPGMPGFGPPPGRGGPGRGRGGPGRGAGVHPDIMQPGPPGGDMFG